MKGRDIQQIFFMGGLDLVETDDRREGEATEGRDHLSWS